ncbi:MAG: metallophosphoesterase family protein [Chloroflexota bacterium]|nr:metallophosphoesterase family protein [Chloroflexota bacterium]
MTELWGVLSDVHGNLPALERALDFCRARGVTRLACLGDVLGDREDEECCRRLMAEVDVVTFGHREVRVRLSVSDEVRSWLRALPATEVVEGILFCHASPASVFPSDIRAEEALQFKRGLNYFKLFPYVSGRAAALCAATAMAGRVELCFHGHTHNQSIWRVENDKADRVTESEYTLQSGTYLIDVGSVGKAQGDRIEFALYSPAERRVELLSLG